MKKILACFLLFYTSFLYSQDPSAPIIAESVVAEDLELKNLQWNRYVTKNFTILSIDNEKGKILSESIEEIKTSSLTRWGFPDAKFSKECRIFCVPNYSLLKKLFNLVGSKVQFRKELSVIWVVLDDNYEKSLSPSITQVSINEYEAAYNTSLPFWFKRGAINLNASTDEVRKNLKFFNEIAKKEQFTHSADQIFSSIEEEYNKQSIDNKRTFDNQAVCLCLMLRKEFGEAKLQGFLRLQNKNKPEKVFNLVYGFSSFSQFDKKYVSYMKDLCGDISDEKTPDFYLKVVPTE